MDRIDSVKSCAFIVLAKFDDNGQIKYPVFTSYLTHINFDSFAIAVVY